MLGTEVISNGVAILNSANMGEGFWVTNNIIDQGSLPEKSFIAEMVFTPTAGFDQGTGQNANSADIFSIGSIWFTDANISDGNFRLRYNSPTAVELYVRPTQAELFSGGAAVPVSGVPNHVAMVYRLGPGRTNNVLDYYLNGDRTATLAFVNNVNSASVGRAIAAFGQAVPGSTFTPRGLDGLVDSLAYATFAGAFSPGHNFQLYRPALYISQSAGQATFTWNVHGYVLEQNASLMNAAGWTEVAGADASPVSLSIGTQSKFFRLRKQ
jgi:hypothetical protein